MAQAHCRRTRATSPDFEAETGLPGYRKYEAHELPDGVRLGFEYETYCINSPLYSGNLLRKFIIQGGKTLQRELKSEWEAFALAPNIKFVVNASGMGFGDAKCFPIRGQIELTNLTTANKTITRQNKDGTWSFVIPRSFNGGTVIGGTKEPGEWRIEPSADLRHRLLTTAQPIIAEACGKKKPLGSFKVIKDVVGRRPAREGGMRVETEAKDNGQGVKHVIHAYGAGGRGYEISWGVASEVNAPRSPDGAGLSNKYWDRAYENLDNGMKQDLNKLRRRFDEDTKKAIVRLAEKKSDPEAKSSLLQLSRGDYCKLNIGEKGEIQQLALTAERRLDAETIKHISRIKHDCQNRRATESDGDDDVSSASELLQICRERQESAEAKQWKFDFLGKERNLNELWGRVVDGVDKLRPAGDLATSTDHTAGLAWGIVKVLLEFAVLGEKGAGSALTGMATAVDAIQRASVYEKQIREVAQGQKPDDHLHIEAFETCLISTYQRIFKFFFTAATCLEKTKPSLYWYVFWTGRDILDFEQDVFKYEQKLFQDGATSFLITQGVVVKQVHNLLLDLNTRLPPPKKDTEAASQSATSSDIALTLSAISSRLDENQRLREEHCLKVNREETLSWFSTIKVKDHHKDAKRHRTTHTAKWIFEREEYKRWSTADNPRLLWIKGIAGAGKTVLVSKIIDEHRKKGSNAAEFQLAYFYCKRDDVDRRFSENILRSFIRQLASSFHPLPDKIHQIYKKKSPASVLSTRIDDREYLALLMELIPQTTETILILDALDECIGDDKESTYSSGEMLRVLKGFEKLLQCGLPVKIIVSSRYDNRVQGGLTGEIVEISPNDNHQDIEATVKKRIDEHNKRMDDEKRPQALISSELRKDIVKVFNEKAQGKFQWASLHIEHLLGGLEQRRLRGPSELKAELGKLPESLIQTYHDVFERIKNLRTTQRETAFRVFRWLLAFEGAFSSELLLAATCQQLKGEPGTKPDEVEGDVEFLLTACQHLVIEQGSVLRFSHLSVQEYCEEHQLELKANCRFDVAKVCAWILFRYDTREIALRLWASSYSKRARRTSDRGKVDGLWQFACENWPRLCKNCLEGAERDEIRNIMDTSPHNSSTGWILMRATRIILNCSSRIIISRNISRRISSGPILAIQLALSLINWMYPLESSRERFRGDFFRHSRSRSCSRVPGILVVITSIFSGILREMKQCICNHLVRHTWSLERAKELSRICEKLWGSQTSSVGDKGRYDENWASLEFRLTEGLEWAPESSGLGTDGSRVNRFRALGRLLVKIPWPARLLHGERHAILGLRRIFDDMDQDFQGGDERRCQEELARLTLLLLCLEPPSLSEEFAEVLFEKFPNASNISYQLLITPVEAFDWSIPLVEAAQNLDSRFLAILISHGASASAETEIGAPLMAAMRADRIENFKFLIERGADVNMRLRKDTYDTVLMAASCFAKMEFLDIILSTPGIQIDAVVETGKFATALIAACAVGSVEAVKKLLNRNAHAGKTVESGIYPNALFAAADTLSMRCVRILLRHGAKGLPEADHRSWRLNSLKTFDISDPDTVDNKSQALVRWLILAFVRGSGIDHGNKGHDSTEGQNNEPSVEGKHGLTEAGKSEDDSSSDDSDSESSLSTDKNEDDDSGNARPDGTGKTRRSDEQIIREEGQQGQDGEGGGIDDDSIAYNLSQLIMELSMDCHQSPQAVGLDLVNAFGFASSKHETALVKGFHALLQLPERSSLDMVTENWSRFLDLAEDCEELGEFEESDDRIGLLAGGGVPRDAGLWD
ncbi:hypothetical protein NM208_g2716 [Fusarium decemcellulare]|uniref:Uncharacterized protein n=1 Tax=Fusarium decemcellulare TaxID=57161 RepID=A0ACC1SRN2_9HYPO|nr:hypothetical protein NM208_g2716 [Fusarium decemcellulare]